MPLIRRPRLSSSCFRATWVLLCGILCATAVAQPEGAQPADQNRPKLFDIHLDKSHLGYTYVGDGGIRYFVTQLSLTNRTDRPLDIPLQQIALLVDGTAFPSSEKFSELTGYDFRVDGQAFRFRELPRADSISLPPEQGGSSWVVFCGLPKSQDVPKLSLQVSCEGTVQQLDITAYFDDALKLRLERIGPRNALGMITIGGLLNSISVGTLVESIDQLVGQGVSRIVIAFGENAVELDEPLGSWLRQTAEGVQTSRTYAMFPSVTSTVRELHVACLPGRQRHAAGEHLHATATAAVEDALATAYRGLPADEVVAEIQHGHPLAQTAALAHGGPDLPSNYLPLLLERATAGDPPIRRAALIALSGSGSEEAVNALQTFARSEDRALAVLALECLAASRFPSAHRALQQLLKAPETIDQATIVRILARYPRHEWADYLSRLARAPLDSVSPDILREVILALGQIGHPELTEILGRTLQSRDNRLRQTSFSLLLSRRDQQSEQLAFAFALEQITHSAPTPQMLQLFDRVRDPRIAPLLISYLDTKQPNKSALINTLARIGPSDIDDELATRFTSFNSDEQAAVLTNLAQLRSDRLPPLAAVGLESQNHVIFNAAVRALGLTATPHAIAILAERLLVEVDAGRVQGIAKALEEIGLPEAQRALEVARNTGQGEKRSLLAKRLQLLRLQSPGGQYLQRAESFVRQEQHEEAIKLFTQALQRDPDLAAAYSGRGHSQLQLKNYEKAEEDFRRGMELDPDDGLAVSGLGIALAISGDPAEAVQIVEEADERFQGDLLFAYNAACVYGRVIEALGEEPSPAHGNEQLEKYKNAGLELLSKSVKLGFSDLDWMREDPDLATFRDDPRFQTLLTSEDEGNDEAEGNDGNRRQPVKPPVPGEQ